ncbi:immunity protein Imm33 domain-containing protein [Sphingomonas sp.]|uniref:immunity protein Imm33 domain-containing protein n=1 Tax=Sphingomonas sp. TaxID=28214 RepID=UPI003D6D3799
MKVFSGDFYKIYRHQDIFVRVNIEYQDSAKWILSYLDSEIKKGASFRENETIQIGWMTLIFKSNEIGGLEIYEPEFGSLPVNWIIGANNTIRHLTLQREVCEQAKVDAVYPSMRQSGVISPLFFEKKQEFRMERDFSQGDDSGWIFRDDGYDDSNATHRSLYEIGCIVPAVIPFLALPPETMVCRSRSNLEIVTPKINISALNNNFILKLMNSAYLS